MIAATLQTYGRKEYPQLDITNPPIIEPRVIPIYKAVLFQAITIPRSFEYSTANLAWYDVNPAYPAKAHMNKRK